MNSDDVIRYLKETPQFFEDHADAISQLAIPHPYGGRTISITERQILSLREQNKALERNMEEMIHFGKENDALGEKMHRLGVAMIAVTTFQSVLHILNFHLRDDFAIPHVAVQLWDKGEKIEDTNEKPVISKDLSLYIDTLLQPYCGAVSNLMGQSIHKNDIQILFGEVAQNIQSIALIALRNAGGCIGMIALGSDDPKRFYSGMGTLYLERLGEMTSAALARISR